MQQNISAHFALKYRMAFYRSLGKVRRRERKEIQPGFVINFF
jgi:hypothetical protein